MKVAISLRLANGPATVDEPLPGIGPLGLSLMGVEEVSPREPMTGLPPRTPKWERTANAYLLPFEIVSVHLLVVLIGAAPEGPPSAAEDEALDARLVAAMAHHSIKDAAAIVASELARPKREVYARALALAKAKER